jgi:MFS family permease
VTDFNTLLLVRGLQAFLSAGLSVLPNAIIRDSYEETGWRG